MKLQTILLGLLLFSSKGNAALPETAEVRTSVLYSKSEEQWTDSLYIEDDPSFFKRVSKMSRDEFEKRMLNYANPLLIKFHNMSLTDLDTTLVTSGYVTTSVKYALREIAVDTSFVQNSQEWLRNFVEGAVGNTEEEDIAVGQTTLQYSEEKWRQKVKQDKFKWGLRVLRWPNQYAYLSGKIGHLGGEEILQWHLRYYVHEFKNQRAEALISVTLPERMFLSTGFLYTPSTSYEKLGRVYWGTVRLTRWNSDKAGAVFLSLDINKKTDIMAGFYRSF